ncbi:MAG: hypothetical protein H6567_12050 [Lewinellaceae bacterium]|nr:hypothetical protein [Lewinellaceae bacterium]
MSIFDKEIVYWLVMASFVMPIFLSIILVWFLLAFQKKKYLEENRTKDALLREQTLLLEKKQAIEEERMRIGSEMHDDLGSGLTTILFLSEKAHKFISNKDLYDVIAKISNQSNTLLENMSEIIWALNIKLDNVGDFIAYIRRYSGEFLTDHGINLDFISEGLDSSTNITGEKRRNLFLVIKELLHNIVKYSQASSVRIRIEEKDNELIVEMEELGGLGFDYDEKLGKGNGLHNINKRVYRMHGNIQFKQFDHGMKYIITIQIN